MNRTSIREWNWWRLLVAVGMAWTAPAAADNPTLRAVPNQMYNHVYKCAGATATPVYQDSPCADGTLLRDFTANPANVSVLPASKRMALSANEPPTQSAPARRHGRKAAPAVGDANERRYLRLGMTEGEILARVGRPDLKGTGQGKKPTVRWTYLPATGDPQTVTTIALESGKAISIDRTVAR